MIIKDQKELLEHVLKVANRVDLDDPRVGEAGETVKHILRQVRGGGARALKQLTQEFDKKTIENFKVDPSGKFKILSSEQQSAVQLAAQRIERFQEACLPKQYFLNEGQDSLAVMFTPLDSVGIYVPGGSAPLISTLMMTAIPAKVARVKRITVVSPPEINDAILAVAEFVGITEIYQIGGAQAVGALAYGVPEIGLRPVDKIVGPGNLYVTLAKKQVYGKVGIDALYGPSELVIIADKFADPKSVAVDLMSQLEHGSGYEAACLFTNSLGFAHEALNEFEKILENQPRKEAINKAWKNYGIIGVTETLEECVELSNLFAPEHLELKVQNCLDILPLIKNAGAIFLNNSNEALGDYLAGPSHCLPTGRSARFSSGLSVVDFLKRTSLVDLKPRPELVEATAILARMEGLEAHAQAALHCKLD
jgi:histidinol dehydrogenase